MTQLNCARTWCLLLLLSISITGPSCALHHKRSEYRDIHRAALDGDLVGVKKALKADPTQIELKDDLGMTPIHAAAKKGHPEVVVYLLDHGASIDTRSNRGGTPLHSAAKEGFTEVVTILAKRGASINLRDNDKRTPLGVAMEWDQPAVVPVLREYGGVE